MPESSCSQAVERGVIGRNSRSREVGWNQLSTDTAWIIDRPNIFDMIRSPTWGNIFLVPGNGAKRKPSQP